MTLKSISTKNKRINIFLPIPDTKNLEIFTFELGEDGEVYSAGAIRKEYDMVVSNYLKYGIF